MDEGKFTKQMAQTTNSPNEVFHPADKKFRETKIRNRYRNEKWLNNHLKR